MKQRKRRRRKRRKAKIEYQVGEEESGVSFHDPIEEYPSIELPNGAGSVEFQCPMGYDPDQEYTQEELIGLIEVHRELLCFFAQMTGYRRCVLGVALDEYDEASGCVPVYVINRQGAKVLMQAEGRKFAQAYCSSEAGKSLMVTFTSEQMTGWFKMKWKLDPGRVMSRSGDIEQEARHNPVIGHLLVDEMYSVIGPPGRSINPAFYSRQEALAAAEVYGVRERVHEVVELYLEGVMGVVIEDTGDILVDGRTAKRFVRACERRGMPINRDASQEIDERVRDTTYSCRQLLTV